MNVFSRVYNKLSVNPENTFVGTKHQCIKEIVIQRGYFCVMKRIFTFFTIFLIDL